MVLSAALRSGYVREPKHAGKRYGKTLYVAYVWGRPVQPIFMDFGAARYIADIINHARVCIERFKGLGVGKGQVSKTATAFTTAHAIPSSAVHNVTHP